MAPFHGTPGVDQPVRPCTADRVLKYQGDWGVTVPNFRDVSRSTAALRARLRPGLLFRSCSPWAAASEADVDAMVSAGIRLVLDLRSSVERQQAASQDQSSALWRRCESGGLRALRVPLLDLKKKGSRLFKIASWQQRLMMIGMKLGLYDEMYLKDRMMPLVDQVGLLGMYTEDVVEDCVEGLGVCLHALLEADHLPVLVHCTAGKDRTAVLCALILASAGFEDEDIAEDYNITEEWIVDIFDPPEGLNAPTFAHTVSSTFKRAPRDTMLAFLSIIKGRHGSVAAFLEDKVGFDRAAQRALHAKLLLDGAEEAVTVRSRL